MHATVVQNVEELTDRLLGWFSFTHASDYPIRPYAMIVAVTLHQWGVTPDTLAVSQINAADAETGGKLTAMFRAVHAQADDLPGGPVAYLPAGWPLAQ